MTRARLTDINLFPEKFVLAHIFLIFWRLCILQNTELPSSNNPPYRSEEGNVRLFPAMFSNLFAFDLSIIGEVAMTTLIFGLVLRNSRFWLVVVKVLLSQLQNGVFLNVTRPRAHGWKKHQNGEGPLARISCLYLFHFPGSSNLQKLPQSLISVAQVNEKMSSSLAWNKTNCVFRVSSKVSFNTVWCTKKGRL